MFLIRCMMLFQHRKADHVECISACICPSDYLRASATNECTHLCVYMPLCIYATLALCISYVTFRRSKRSTFRRSKRSTFRRSKRSPDRPNPTLSLVLPKPSTSTTPGPGVPEQSIKPVTRKLKSRKSDMKQGKKRLFGCFAAKIRTLDLATMKLFAFEFRRLPA